MGAEVRMSYAIVHVSDMQRAVTFYRDVLGLPLKFQSPGWTEFATGGASLALHGSRGTTAGHDDPQSIPAGRCCPGLSVENLDEFHARMLQHKVPCSQEPKEVFGSRVAQYLDPDGLAISVSQQKLGA